MNRLLAVMEAVHREATGAHQYALVVAVVVGHAEAFAGAHPPQDPTHKLADMRYA